jgi:hypothetical protein
MIQMKQCLAIIIILIFCMISGCLGIESDPINVRDDLSPYDFELNITTVEKIINVENEGIELIIDLINHDEISIRLETYRIDWPHIEIIDPNGSSHTLFHGNITVAPNYEIIEPGDKLSSMINLKGYGYYDGSFDWNVLGVYQCKVEAYGLTSNIWEFEMI